MTETKILARFECGLPSLSLKIIAIVKIENWKAERFYYGYFVKIIAEPEYRRLRFFGMNL